jgi:RNA 2',3'-cyclic 3'-phosphodiesterase
VSMVRAFIAISLPPEITRGLDGVLKELKSRLPGRSVRWVAAGNIHLTLKFLGDVSSASLDALERALDGEARLHAPFEFGVSGLGCFPSPRRPRVLWVGLQAPPALAALQRGVEAQMARQGYSAEERPFSPHLTLGRVSREAGPEDLRRIGAALEAYQPAPLGICRVDAIHLVRSDLQPGGAVYTRLFSAPLSAASNKTNTN